MSTLRNQRLQKRNISLLNHFNNLRQTKENGVFKFTYTYCLEQVAQKFYLSISTAEKIIVATRAKQKEDSL